MVQKTKKVCIGPLQTHAKSQSNWLKFEILIFDPCFKKHTPDFFWDTLQVLNILNLHCHYEIGIVPNFGPPEINVEASRAQNLRGGRKTPPPVQSRVKGLLALVLLFRVQGYKSPKGCYNKNLLVVVVVALCKCIVPLHQHSATTTTTHDFF